MNFASGWLTKIGVIVFFIAKGLQGFPETEGLGKALEDAAMWVMAGGVARAGVVKVIEKGNQKGQ